MAPEKRKRSEVSPNRDLVIKPIGRPDSNRRITRSLTIKEGAVSSSSSATRRSSSSSSAAAAARKQASSTSASKKKGNKQPPPKKLKKTPKKTDEQEEKSGDEPKSVSLDKTSDDVKKSASDNNDDDGDKIVAEAGGSSSSSKTTIIIEHCKNCNSFKKRANEAMAGLKKSIPGISVLINPDKPRVGCFEIRAEDGRAFVSLLDMKRPYKKMKDLDMDEVVADIVKEIGE